MWPRLVHEGRGMKATSNTSFAMFGWYEQITLNLSAPVNRSRAVYWCLLMLWEHYTERTRRCWLENTARGADEAMGHRKFKTLTFAMPCWSLERCDCVCVRAFVMRTLLIFNTCPFFLFDSYVYFYSYFPIRIVCCVCKLRFDFIRGLNAENRKEKIHRKLTEKTLGGN